MKKNHIALYLALFIFGLTLLFVPKITGIADNSDFSRVLQPLGLKSNENLKLFYFQDKYEYVEKTDNLFLHLKSHAGIKPISKDQYKSTLTFPIKIAQAVNGVFYYMTKGSIKHFNVAFLGIILLLLHSLGIVLLWKGLSTGNIFKNAIMFFIIVIIFFDTGYLVYFNSFYGEGLTLVSFILWFSSLYLIICDKSKSYKVYFLNFLSALMFMGAKVANIPLGAGIIALYVYMMIKESLAEKRILIGTAILSVMVAGIYYYTSVPQWMKDVNSYHSVFYGILKDSKDPDSDLAFFGISEEYSALKDTHGYMDHRHYDIYGTRFRTDVYDKATPVNVLCFYILHPKRLYEKAKISAESSISLRPLYLGNYRFSDDREILKFSTKFSLWEELRKTFSQKALFIILLVFISYIFILLNNLIRKKDYSVFILKAILPLFALIQFFIPVVCNGEADLAKHMFLFNVIFDMMIIVISYEFLKRKRSFMGLFVLFLLIIYLLTYRIQNVPENRKITFGTYGNQPMEWIILDESEECFFIVAKDIIHKMKFSESDNRWNESDLRIWLNNESSEGFLHQFTEEEKDRIKTVPLESIISPCYADLSEKGHQPHYWVSNPGYAMQNYNNSYMLVENEKVFVLSIKEWESYDFNKRKNSIYWLRTPYTQRNAVRTVGKDGFVYHKLADMENVGVLPAMYIKKKFID